MDFLLSSSLVALGTLLSRVFGLLRDMLFARHLGAGLSSDVFFAAYRLPNFFRTLFAEGAFSAAFVPILSGQLVERDRDGVLQFLRNMFSLLLYSMLLFCLGAEIFMPQLVALVVPGFSSNVEKYRLTVTLSRITFPYLVFIALTSFMAGVLHCRGKFLAVALNPLLLNLVFILASLLSPLLTPDISRLLSYAVLIGGFLQFFCLFLAVASQKIILRPQRLEIDRATREFAKKFSSALLGSAMDQINSVVSSILLSRAAGAISLVYYADRLVQLPTSLLGTALGVSLVPLLSKKIRRNDGDRFEIQEDALLTALFLGLPAMVYLYRLSYIFVPILFERGEFSSASSQAVVEYTKIYACALPAFILSKILQSIFFSSGDTKTPMVSALISLLSNVSIALALVGRFGSRGILIASVLSSYLDFGSLLVILLVRGQLILSERFLLVFAKILYSLIFLVLTAVACDKFIPLDQMLAPGLVKFVATALLSGIVYLAISYLSGLIRLGKKHASTGGRAG